MVMSSHWLRVVAHVWNKCRILMLINIRKWLRSLLVWIRG